MFLGSLMLSRVQRLSSDRGDFAIGFAFALWLYCLTRIESERPNVLPVYERSARLLSKCSYSVYAVHFPVALLIRTSLGISRWTPAPGNLLAAGAGCCGVFLFGLLFSRLTEAHTDTVRAGVLRLFSPPVTVRRAAVGGVQELR
jgi:peptidoglycan/LPS O-acetylase OafA/YrhL